jgi:excisionase family DNA binding protein
MNGTVEAAPQLLLTVAEVAGRLHVSRQTVWRRVRSGELRAVRVGGHLVRVPADAVDELVRNYNGSEAA